MLVIQPVSPNVHNGRERDTKRLSSRWDSGDSECINTERCKRRGHSQPVNLLVVREAKDELVDNSINAYSPTDEFKRCIVGVVEYEMIEIEFAQASPANSSCQLHKSVTAPAPRHGHTVGT